MALGMVAARLGPTAAALLRLAIVGNRQSIRQSPAEHGLQSEPVEFPSNDGVALRGWFVQRSGGGDTPAPAIVFVHGWGWNRLGNQAGQSVLPDRTVRFLPAARALAAAGFHVLLFDLRNHGESAAAPPVTFGVRESRDVVGAVAMLRKRPDVDKRRIGLLGFSMGANAAIYAVPRCQPIRAAVAVQPTTASVFEPRLARTMMGVAGPLLAKLTEPVHMAFGAPPRAAIAPGRAAPYLGETRVLYIQGSGDQWGTVEDVQAIAAATPNAQPLVVVPSEERFGGYLYVEENPEAIVRFFEENI
jgi:pimeloyl-ACP methyl ester carboxylesterase